jgi:hypothetical protein
VCDDATPTAPRPYRQGCVAAPLEAANAEGEAPSAAAGKQTNIIKNPTPLGDGFRKFYGEATSSSSYGGYGGNENNFDKFKYFYDVPDGWQPDSVNKTEKSTNGRAVQSFPFQLNFSSFQWFQVVSGTKQAQVELKAFQSLRLQLNVIVSPLSDCRWSLGKGYHVIAVCRTPGESECGTTKA